MIKTDLLPQLVHENSAPKASGLDGPVVALPHDGHFSGAISWKAIARFPYEYGADPMAVCDLKCVMT